MSHGLVQSFTSPTDDVRFAVVMFSKVSTKLFDLKSHLNPTSVADAVIGIPTRTSVEQIHTWPWHRSEDKLGLSSGGRYIAKDAVIVLTDGRSGHPTLTADEVKLLKTTGATITTVVGHTKEELTTMSTKPENIFTTDDHNLDDYIKKEFSRTVCDIEHTDKITF
ncbi:hypothetical protein Btru_076929 [Bulinus truncatus]|nr:hypothetical protein Btru_076929 [Bulinus truncatus]